MLDVVEPLFPLGGHEVLEQVIAKREEWLDYIKHVSPWEIDRYLGMY